MKTLFAGPWIGEFGYELFEWQGKLRKISKDFDKVIVSSREGNKVLYEDFCDEFIPFDSTLSKCSEHFNTKSTVDKRDRFIKKENIKADTIIRDSNFNSPQEFVKYGVKNDDDAYDLIIHARFFRGYKTTRNWKVNRWIQLVDMLLNDNPDLKICSIGVSEVAKHIPHTESRMDIPLKQLSNVMASSKLCVGQSSGAMHFASLCGCKHIVWSSKKNRQRYLKGWNPFDTKVVFYDKGRWNPKTKSIFDLIKNNL